MFLGLFVGALFAIFIVASYWKGVEHGKKFVNKEIPKIITNPITAVAEFVEKKKDEQKNDEMMKEMETIVNYDAETALDAIKQERLRQ